MSSSTSAIAVIGLACNFPGSRTPNEYWDNLSQGVESICFFSEPEMLSFGVSREQVDNPLYIRAASVICDPDQFDASFFSMTEVEARLCDPQHRLFMECSWRAFEDAGYVPSTYNGWVGVYAGAGASTYWANQVQHDRELMAAVTPLQILLGNEKDYLALRVSYKLNLKGPSVTIQTACSSSLVAVIMACQALLTFQCDAALAGGACVRAPQMEGYLYQRGGVLSGDGHTRPFQKSGSGTLFGSGVGCVLLKRLSDAIRDRDRIRAVIRGFAVNNDGSAKVGFTAPGVEGVKGAARLALQIADLQPSQIAYVEAHGTGTALGDSVELAALSSAYETDPNREGFCSLGSVKANLGHLGAAAGIAAFIKAVLMLERRQIPPLINQDQNQQNVKKPKGPFYFSHELENWPYRDEPMRASVNSMGMGGTNAHVVLEEAPSIMASTAAMRKTGLLLLSARDRNALRDSANAWRAFLSQQPDSNNRLADIAYTSQVGRQSFSHRRAIVLEEPAQVIQELNRVETSFSHACESPRIAFVLPHDFRLSTFRAWAAEPQARAKVSEYAAHIKKVVGVDLERSPLIDVGSQNGAMLPESLVERVLGAMAVQIAMVEVVEMWGVSPDLVAATGAGVFAATWRAGLLELPECIHWAYRVSLMFDRFRSGLYLHPEESLREMLQNAEDDELQAILKTVKKPKLPLVILPNISWNPTREALYSATVSSLARAVAEPEAETRTILEDRVDIGLRVGQTVAESREPGRNLVHYGLLDAMEDETPDLRRTEIHLTRTLGDLWERGIEVDWEAYHKGEERTRVEIPTYPFQRSSYWAAGSNSMITSSVHASDRNNDADTVDGNGESENLSEERIAMEIRCLWQQLLGTPVTDPGADFFDLGGDSLIGIQVASRLSEKYNVELDAVNMFRASTSTSLARYVLRAVEEKAIKQSTI